MSTTKLTNEQRKLVEDNHDLIYGFLNKKELDIDKYYDIMALELCNASINYDSSKGKFSTFVYKCMYNRLIKIICSENRQCRKPPNGILSYDKECVMNIFDKTDESYINLIIADNKNTTDDIVIGMDYYNFKSKLKDREKIIMQYLESGYNRTQIGKMMGRTPQAIDSSVRKIKDKWLNFIK